LYPTLTTLCGLAAPKHLEGVSLVPLLNNPAGKVKEVALIQTPRPNYPRRTDPKVMGYSIRSNRYRYTEWQNFKTGHIAARELYDHKDDPNETVNLAQLEKYKQQINQLSTLLQKTLRNQSAKTQ